MRITIVLAILAFSSFLFLTSCGVVLAQNTTTSSATLVLDPGAVDVGSSLISPASPLYFLKSLREKIETLVSSTPTAKLGREVEFTVRRLREINSLVKNKHQEFIPSTIEKYNFHLNQANGLAGDKEELKMKVAREKARHLDVLQRVYDGVGNPQAKMAIRAQIVRIQEQNNNLIESLSLQNQQLFISNVALRQVFACQFLNREATSSALNDTEKVYIGEKAVSCKQNMEKFFQDFLH